MVFVVLGGVIYRRKSSPNPYPKIVQTSIQKIQKKSPVNISRIIFRVLLRSIILGRIVLHCQFFLAGAKYM